MNPRTKGKAAEREICDRLNFVLGPKAKLFSSPGPKPNLKPLGELSTQ